MRLLVAIAAALLAPGAALAEPSVIDAEAFFPEGPYVSDGVLYYVEYAGNMAQAWDGTAITTLWTQDGCGPSAIAPFGDGWIVTCYDAGSLVTLSAGGAVTGTISADSAGDPLVGPNDIALDGKGGLWVTASGPWDSAPIVGKIYHLAAPGAAPRPVADDLHYANGIALAPAGDRLYLAESEAGRVISFAVAADGSLSDRRLFARLFALDDASGAGAYPDGMEWGPDGNLWVGQYSSGRILAIAPDATLSRVIEVPAATAPNLAFAVDGATLYVTAVDQTDAAPYAGKVWAVPLD